MSPHNPRQLSSDDSSSEDEEERARMAAIQSVAIDSSAVVQSAASSKSKAQKRTKGSREARADAAGSDVSDDEQNGGLKHYQLKAQDALHGFLDTTFGRLISEVDAPVSNGGGSSFPQQEARGNVEDVGGEPVKDTPGIQLFGRLPKRKAPTESEKRAIERSQFRQKRHDEGRDFNEDAKEVKDRLTSAAMEPDVIRKAAERAARRAVVEAKEEDARWQKEMTDEGQRVAKLKRERGIAQLIKGRIVMVKEPVSEEVKDGKEGEGKAKKKKKKAKKGNGTETEGEDLGASLPDGRMERDEVHNGETIDAERNGKRRKKKKKKVHIEPAETAPTAVNE